MKNWNYFFTKSTLQGLALGQILSLLVTIAGFTSSQIARKGVDTPFSQCFLNYVLLALVYGGIFLYRREPFKAKFYHYILLAFIDTSAKFFVIKAYQHTYLTSVTLLECWTIPFVVFFVWLFFKTKYGYQQLIGVAICVIGLITVVLSDVHYADRSSGSNPLKGDLAIIIGATFYGISNVYKEVFAKNVDHVELMAWLGYYGAILCASQISSEHKEFISIISSPWTMIFQFIEFSLAMFLFYSGVPFLLKISGSTMLNMSLLTSNIWVVLVRIFAYHEKVDWIYFVAFATITLGLIVCSWGEEMNPNNGEVVVDPNNGEAAVIDDEVGLGHSKNVEISNNDEISFQEAQNSSCHITIKIQADNARE